MPSKDPTQRFEDILENITLIEEFTAGMDLTAFTEDLMPEQRRLEALRPFIMILHKP